MPRNQKSLVFTNRNYQNNAYEKLPLRRSRSKRSNTPRRSRSRSRSMSRSRSVSLKTRKTKTRINYGPIDGFVHRFISRFGAIIFDPYTYVGIALLSILMYIHHYHIDDSAINGVVSKLKGNDSTKPFGEWIEKNVNKIFALTMILYHSIQIPLKYRYFTALISIFFVLLMPALSLVNYACFVFSLVLYHKMRNRVDKFFIIFLFIILTSWVYYDDILKFHLKTANSTATINSRPKRDSDDTVTET
jgi:hypothetical protein